jgi:hypothetical protein
METQENVKKFNAEIHPGGHLCCRYGTDDGYQRRITSILESIADTIIQKPGSTYCAYKISWEGRLYA